MSRHSWLNIVQDWMNRLAPSGTLLGNTPQQWLGAALVAVVVWIALRVFNGWLRRRAEALSQLRRAEWLLAVAAVLERTKFWFVLLASIWAGSLLLSFPNPLIRARLETVVTLALLAQAGLWGAKLIQFLIQRNQERRLAEQPAEATTIAALGFVAQLALYVVVLLLMLDNLGINVTALVAGLGIGGIAVALAAQNVLSDLFSSMSIVLDKPFVLGDFISVDDARGTVEHIGLKTTRLRSLTGEQLIFSNSDLLKSRIRNFKRMRERRMQFSIGVVYSTPPEKLREIPEMIRQAVAIHEQARFDRAHFTSFGDSSLNFEAVYFVLDPNFTLAMDIQQAINLELLGRFAARGIEFAFPTRTVQLQSAADRGPARLADGAGT